MIKFTQSCAIFLVGKHLLKKKYIQANQAPFLNNILSKDVMKRSRLRNKYLKQRSNTNKLAYNKQRNYCVSLFCKEKNFYFNNIKTKSIIVN